MSASRLQSVRLETMLGAVLLAALTGCATLGGNVKGSFSCDAPDGICAPSSSIDDRALAMIAGDSGAVGSSPAGPYLKAGSSSKPSHTAVTGSRLSTGQTDTRRTQERVLRIVFQPFVDEQGRLHEASAVHAVVRRGEWEQQVRAIATASPVRISEIKKRLDLSLAEATDRADPDTEVVTIDPDLPDPAVVAAARARAVDPVGSTKSEGAARLAPKTSYTSPAQPVHVVRGRATAEPAVGAAAVDPRSSTGTAISARMSAASATIAAPPRELAVGQGASTGVKASPQTRGSAIRAEGPARGAAARAPLPDANPPSKTIERAAGFPSAVPEDD